MIEDALNSLASELNEYLRLKHDLTEEKALVTGLVDIEGKTAVEGENKITITLLHVEEESVLKSGVHSRQVDGQSVYANPPIHTNIYVLFSAFFASSNYGEALKYLSDVLAFFQGKYSFNRQNTPALPESIDKLLVEMYKTSFQELSHLWGMVGAKQLPSVIYKVRMLTFDQGRVTEQRPAVHGDASNAHKNEPV